jgi:uncharacterized membrane protein
MDFPDAIMQTTVEVPSPKRSTAITLNRMVYRICRHWMVLFSVLYGLYVLVPFLAPVFMALGVMPLGRAIYAIYSFLCHQLPERSLFLFGPKIMVPLADIQTNWKVTDNPLILRQFVGNPALGWKVAWSDRMVYMFTSILFLAWIWWIFRSRLPKLSWKGLVLFLLPMAVDGGTHFISDLFGHHQGFRDTNAWLAALTQHFFSPTFYAGDAWGSFNATLRMVTGILFGIGIVWFGFPYLEEYFKDQAAWIKYKFERANLHL